MSVTPYESAELSSVDLNASTTKGLNQWQVESLQHAVLDINQAISTAGQATLAAAAQLYEIKGNIGKGNWTALLKSGVIKLTPKNAVDLCNAHEKWLINADVDEAFIGLLSCRSLNAMANADEKARQRVYGLLKKSTTDNKVRMSESEVRRQLRGQKVMDRMKAKTSSVDERILKLTELNAELSKKNKELRAENTRLRGLVGSGAS